MCDEESAELVKIFTNTDRDGNGTLEFAEVQLALKCQGYTDKQIRVSSSLFKEECALLLSAKLFNWNFRPLEVVSR